MSKKTVLKKGEEENELFRRCRQTQCQFFINGGCKACSKCGSEPYAINKGCHECYDCENVPDSLRWGDNKKKASEATRISHEGVVELLKAIIAANNEAIRSKEEQQVIIEKVIE